MGRFPSGVVSALNRGSSFIRYEKAKGLKTLSTAKKPLKIGLSLPAMRAFETITNWPATNPWTNGAVKVAVLLSDPPRVNVLAYRLFGSSGGAALTDPIA